MALLALDLGTKTGWALDNAGAIVSGTANFTPRRYDSAAMRFLRFTRWLDEIHELNPIEHIAYEEVRRHAGTTAAHLYGGLMSHLLTWADPKGIPVEAHPVGAIKKHWTGAGNASKEAMIAEARKRGFEPGDDNEADALAILSMMRGGL
jgi:Holliday junction resolvasome RuvABC endonuclease subunit